LTPEPRSDGTLRERLDAGLAGLGLETDDAQRDSMIRFLRLLERWNRAYNLTAVRDPTAMVPLHLLDSLAIAPFLGDEPVLDLGTGAGLPGIPLAILRPSWRFVLLDSNGKKARFVRQAALELGLANVEVVHARMESYRPEPKFATIVSRAVTILCELTAAAESLLARPGRLLVMKGRYPHDELAAVRAGPPLVHRLTVPGVEGERHLVEIRYD
jgi:16S rRNA (guanine527-N7)-methyltransferase